MVDVDNPTVTCNPVFSTVSPALAAVTFPTDVDKSLLVKVYEPTELLVTSTWTIQLCPAPILASEKLKLLPLAVALYIADTHVVDALDGEAITRLAGKFAVKATPDTPDAFAELSIVKVAVDTPFIWTVDGEKLRENVGVDDVAFWIKCRFWVFLVYDAFIEEASLIIKLAFILGSKWK